jgi:hypothetical protein
MKIEVTRGDIEGGTPLSPGGCAAALAIRRATGLEAGVTRELAVIYGGPSRVDGYYLPAAAGRFIERFDARLPIEPFAFDWDLSEGNRL